MVDPDPPQSWNARTYNIDAQSCISAVYYRVGDATAQNPANQDKMSGEPGPSRPPKGKGQAPPPRQQAGSVDSHSMLEAAFLEASSESPDPISPVKGKGKGRASSFDEFYDVTPPSSPSKTSKKTKKTRPQIYDESMLEIERELEKHAREAQAHQREEGRQRTIDYSIVPNYREAIRIRKARVDRANVKREYDAIGQDPSGSSDDDDGSGNGGNGGDFGGSNGGGTGGESGGNGQSASKPSTTAKYMADFDNGKFKGKPVDDFRRPLAENSKTPKEEGRTPNTAKVDRIIRISSARYGSPFATTPARGRFPLPLTEHQRYQERLARRREQRVLAERAMAKEKKDALGAALPDLGDLSDLSKDEKRWVDKVIEIAVAPVSKDKVKADGAFRNWAHELARMPDPIKDNNPDWDQYLENMRNVEPRAGSKALDDILHGKWAEREADFEERLASLRPSKSFKGQPKAMSEPSQRTREISKAELDDYWTNLRSQVIQRIDPEWYKEQQEKIARGELPLVRTEEEIAESQALMKEVMDSDWLKDLRRSVDNYQSNRRQVELHRLKTQNGKALAPAKTDSPLSEFTPRPAAMAQVARPIATQAKPASVTRAVTSQEWAPAIPGRGWSREEHAAAEEQRRAKAKRLVMDTGFNAHENYRARLKHVRMLDTQEKEAAMPPNPPSASVKAGTGRGFLTASGNPIYVDFMVKIMLMRGLAKIKCEKDQNAPTLSKALREVEKAYRYAMNNGANDELLGRCSYWQGHIENEMMIRGLHQTVNRGKSLIHKAASDVSCYFEGDLARWRIKHWDDSLTEAKQAAYAKSTSSVPESPMASSPQSAGSFGSRRFSSGGSPRVMETIPDFDSEHSSRSASLDHGSRSPIRNASGETNRNDSGTALHDNGGPLSPSHPDHPYYAGPKVDTTAAAAAPQPATLTEGPENVALPNLPSAQSYRNSDRTVSDASLDGGLWSAMNKHDETWAAMKAANTMKKHNVAVHSPGTESNKSPRRASYVPSTPGSVYSPVQGALVSPTAVYKPLPPVTPTSPSARADSAIGHSTGVFGHSAASEPSPTTGRKPSIIQRRHSRSKSVAFDLDDGAALTKPASPGALDTLRRRLSIFSKKEDVLREAEEGCSSPRLPDVKE